MAYIIILLNIVECFYIFSTQRGKFIGRHINKPGELTRVGFVDGSKAVDFEFGPSARELKSKYEVTIKTKDGSWIDQVGATQEWQEARTSYKAIFYPIFNGLWDQSFQISLGADGKFYITSQNFKCLGWSIKRNQIEFDECDKLIYKEFEIYSEIKGGIEPIRYVQNSVLVGQHGIKKLFKRRASKKSKYRNLKRLLGLTKHHTTHHKVEADSNSYVINDGRPLHSRKTNDDKDMQIEFVIEEAVPEYKETQKADDECSNLKKDIKDIVHNELHHIREDE